MSKGKIRKPAGYWTKELCKEEALKFKTKAEFRREAGAAYDAAHRLKCIDYVCEHMTPAHKPRGYWTKETCRKEAEKYSTKRDFAAGSATAYVTAKKSGWIDDICEHMIALTLPSGYWTKENCHKEALTHKTRVDLQRKCPSAYIRARANGWLDDICGHMTETQKPNGYWTKKRCAREAKRFNTRTEFARGCSAAYDAAVTNKWVSDICGHMEIKGSLRLRAVYAFTFASGHVYVGITCNIKRRLNDHLEHEGSAVFQHIKETGSSYEFEQLTPYVDVKAASKKERELITKYKAEGRAILNRTDGGELGGSVIKWTKDKCKREALKYDQRSLFRDGSSSAYGAALRDGYLDEICSHMVSGRGNGRYWTKERTALEAKKYNTRTEFKRGNGSAYGAACRNGWLNDICGHMIETAKPAGYWTKDNCAKEAKKYETRTAFKKGSSGAFTIAGRNGWLDDICEHMPKQKSKDHWTKENCQKEAIKCRTRSELKEVCYGAYRASLENGWLDEICGHMPSRRAVKNKKPT
ncbi:GIY-YIG nuclease family protein [Photobacterium angustum]|uniref:GIY-YIG nuclease family protein n=1 Tax=Photobacterium angustum TaxID=661 RepID=UPI0005E8EFE4|nr:GIY-YIG nuclease family protein [Photobacterium angustum]KJG00099.1 hypothetical protein UB35_19805 [Photobacterium angustum]PSV61700.1 hypothetical protein CTM95_20575 [Photobacterium angustum]